MTLFTYPDITDASDEVGNEAGEAEARNQWTRNSKKLGVEVPARPDVVREDQRATQAWEYFEEQRNSKSEGQPHVQEGDSWAVEWPNQRLEDNSIIGARQRAQFKRLARLAPEEI